MNLYTNGFSCAVRGDGGEVVIDFVQTMPIVGENGKVALGPRETVAPLVMSVEMATELVAVLGKIIHKDPPAEERDN